ncbi:MAG: efflux RND transporter periplasmic adaptor subunit [Burkholderiaceae bacterium]|nr:efflux RND transporter periplasmic adaptor subunit [Burkholderiaceae bacterium]
MRNPDQPPGRSRVAWLLALSCVIAAAAAWLSYDNPVGATAQQKTSTPDAMPVSVAEVVERTVTEWDEFSGRLEAIDGVEVRSRVAGYIEAVKFEPGSFIEKGDTLFVIDPRPFAAAVARAEAALASARARLVLTASELGRAQRLLDDRAIAQREFDERNNAHREAQAAVQGAQAALDSARLELGYTRIVSPISGRVGRAEVTEGNLVGAGAGGPRLTTILSTTPIYATFEVDERSFLRYAAHADGDDDGEPMSASVPIFLGLADEKGHPHRGRLEFVDNRIDPRSGTILLRAVFDNPDGRLKPGMYARLKIGGSGSSDAVLVADRAIGTDQNKRFVLVVGEGSALEWREVKLGPMVEGLRVVRDGLRPGERIVVNGLQRVRPGMRVAPKLVAMEEIGATTEHLR